MALTLIALGAVAIALVAASVLRNGGTSTADAGPVHVHGLGINPSDQALFIATHTGLWRVGTEERRAERVTDRNQDTMGFTVVGPDLFLGSGHPDLREDLPPLLGLIESSDGGETWEPISLLGEADFHVLRSTGDRVYGFDSSGGRLLFSRNRGRTWTEREPPGALLDLAVDPSRLSHLVASGERGLVTSLDDGRNWSGIGSQLGLLAWPIRDRLYLVDESGSLSMSRDGGRTWQRAGAVDGAPAAFLAQSATELYVALHDGTVKRSVDGGASWAVRSTP